MANNALVFGVHLADEQNFFVTASKARFAHCCTVRFDENRKLARGENMQLVISCFTACFNILVSRES